MRLIYFFCLTLLGLWLWQTTEIPVTTSSAARRNGNSEDKPETPNFELSSPTPSPATRQGWLALLNEVNPWGVVTNATSAKDQAYKPWKIVGVANTPSEPFVLIRFEGKSPEPRRIGEELPGGSKIKAIHHDHICLIVNGIERRLPFYL